jgi:hypothetical protein
MREFGSLGVRLNEFGDASDDERQEGQNKATITIKVLLALTSRVLLWIDE